MEFELLADRGSDQYEDVGLGEISKILLMQGAYSSGTESPDSLVHPMS